MHLIMSDALMIIGVIVKDFTSSEIPLMKPILAG